ncbi:MAG: type II toxin-antitoxin system Phd/YefM family antitoxin [Acidimicrobiia bacterium]|nr:type II toxin-antitoxin system Phd/YefM family antitoxin [Acidimicrobiia bacterium]
MRDISATEAGRAFSALLDAIEHDGESFTIVRHGRRVAELKPAGKATGARLREVLSTLRADESFASDVAGARAALVEDDPWTD